MSASLRILVADDHEMVRKGLRTILEAHSGWTVCAEAANGREAVALAQDLHPDIVIMDLTMPEFGGLEATRRICKDVPHTKVLVLSMHKSEQLMHEVLRAGARGYVLKSDAGKCIVEAIEALEQGKPYFTPELSELLLKAYLTPDGHQTLKGESHSLTPREREIVQLIAEGKGTKEIGTLLGISERTADTHRTNLMRKLEVHSVAEIVRYAIRNRMIEP